MVNRVYLVDGDLEVFDDLFLADDIFEDADVASGFLS